MKHLKEYELFEGINTIDANPDVLWTMERCLEWIGKKVWRIDLYDSDKCIWGLITSDPDADKREGRKGNSSEYYNRARLRKIKDVCPDSDLSKDEFIRLYSDYKENKQTIWYNHIFNLMRGEFDDYKQGKPSNRNGVIYDSRVKKGYMGDYTQDDLYMIGYVLNRGILNYFDPEWIDI